MRSLLTLFILLSISISSYSQQTWQKIYDSSFYGIRNFESMKIFGTNTKLVFVQNGLNYPIYGVPNGSGNIYRLNKNFNTWYMPYNGFLNSYWCFGGNPPSVRNNPTLKFLISPFDTNMIMKYSSAYCGGYDGGDLTSITWNSGLNYIVIDSLINGAFNTQNKGFDVDPKNDSILLSVYWQDNKIYKSTNRGLTWFRIANISGTINPIPIGYLKFDPWHSNYVYVRGFNELLISSNGGYNFISIPAVNPNKLFFDYLDSSVYGITNTTLYRSMNHGLNWTQLYTFPSALNTIEINPDNSNRIYAGCDNGLWRSTDKGVSFTLYNNSFGISNKVIGLSKDPETLDSIYTCTDKAVYKVWAGKVLTVDTSVFSYMPLAVGNTWVYNFSSNPFPNPNCYGKGKIIIIGSSVINGHVYFQKYNRNPNGSSDTSYIRIDSLTGNLLMYTTNQGCAWLSNERILDSLSARLNDSLTIQCTFRFRCNDTLNQNLFGYNKKSKNFYWTDNFEQDESRKLVKDFGLSFRSLSLGATGICTQSLNGCVINGIVYGDTNMTPTFSVSGTIRFKDNQQPVTSGKVKAVKFNPLTGQQDILDSALIQANGNYTLPKVPQDSVDIMAYQDDDVDYIPTFHDSTIYWQYSHTIYPIAPMTNINIYADRLIKSQGSYTISGKVYQNNNNKNVNPTLNGARTYLMAGNTFKNSDMTINNGNYSMDSILPGTYTLLVDMLGYYYQSRPVIISNFSKDTINFHLDRLVAVKSNSDNIPVDFRLYYNYPNPFNPITKIRFDIPESSPIPLGKGLGDRLVIYNSLGQLVQTLVNEALQPGTYEVEFDGTSYPSGVYFYQLTTSNFTETKKMVLIK